MDKEYWKKIYKQQNEESKPSLFAEYIADSVGIEGKKIIELGCGNGRDAVYFANQDALVTAVDQCENIIEMLQNKFMKIGDLHFVCDDFTHLGTSDSFDIVYSRFTLHSISSEQEDLVLNWAKQHLNSGGHFCIEVRGQKNEIYKVGTPVVGEPDAFVLNDHYRRFINFDNFCTKLQQLGFIINYAAEEKGFAPYNGENETYIRIIAQKPQ